MRRTESAPGLSHALAQPRVLKYCPSQPYHFLGAVDPQRRAGGDGAIGRLREIVSVMPDQYRHTFYAGLDQVLTAVGKLTSSDERSVSGPILCHHFAIAVPHHDAAVSIVR